MSLVPEVEASATSATAACKVVCKRVYGFFVLLSNGDEDLDKINNIFTKNHFISLGYVFWHESTFSKPADGLVKYYWVNTTHNRNFKIICEGVYTVSRRD